MATTACGTPLPVEIVDLISGFVVEESGESALIEMMLVENAPSNDDSE